MAFGRRLVEQPLMRNVLADLALESEAAMTLMARLSRAYDEHTDEARAFARIATAAAKFWVCKRAPHLTYEAMECLGGNGYAEESMMPRLYREAPVNAIWEGSGNVICLDVLRALAREPGSLSVLLAELHTSRGGNARYDAALARFEVDILDGAEAETRARTLTEAMAVLLQASLLIRHAPSFVADAFCASRLGDGGTLVFGTLPVAARCKDIVERAAPTSA
jgi:putative acyl-CoA dehydrogenase